ncbi:MAG TPA: hypothetical protein VK095_12040, partial [Beutenbergiaceae bacterium]|nr:hypothetical protein [Beutenbergiaceae bacterium]
KQVLIGATSHEFNRAAEQIEQPLSRRISPLLLTGFGMPGARARAYPAAFPGRSGVQLLGQAITDRLFRLPVMRLGAARERPEPAGPDNAGARPEALGRTWVYDFRWRSAITGLATHCLDLPFSWDNLDAERVAQVAGEHPPAQLADAMHWAFVCFITGADPGWSPYTPQHPTGRVFDTESWTGRDPYRFERLAVQAEPAG